MCHLTSQSHSFSSTNWNRKIGHGIRENGKQDTYVLLMWSALLTLPAMLSPWAVSHDGRGGGNIEKPMSTDTLAQVPAVRVLVGVLTGALKKISAC